MTPSPTTRTAQDAVVNVRMKSDLTASLDALADREGVSRSEIARRLMVEGVERLDSPAGPRGPVRLDLDAVLFVHLNAMEHFLLHALGLHPETAVLAAARAGDVLLDWAEEQAERHGIVLTKES